MKIQYNLIILLAAPLFIYTSEQPQVPSTITNITPADIEVNFYENPYRPSLLNLLGFKYGERDKNALNLIATYHINAHDIMTFNENLAGISLPTRNNPYPNIYLIDQQHAYTLEFNQQAQRILTIIENGKIKEPITCNQKNRIDMLTRQISEYIKNNRIDQIEKIAPQYRCLRNAFPEEANKREKELGLISNNNMQLMFALENNPTEKPTEHTVEEVN